MGKDEHGQPRTKVASRQVCPVRCTRCLMGGHNLARARISVAAGPSRADADDDGLW